MSIHKVGEYEVKMYSIFDLEADGDKLIMPFNPVDYGKDNTIDRFCNECKGAFKQGEMKELGISSCFGSGLDKHQLYNDGFFVCQECWFEIYADASKWSA